jgi:hypothetical protein
MYIHFFFFSFVFDIYVFFASASSDLAAPSYNSPRSTWECTDLLHTFHAFCHYTPVLPNILLAVEVGQCPLAPSRQDIVIHRAAVRPLARQNILPLTGADDSEQFHCVIQKCYQSAHHDGTCSKESNPCSVIYNISPRRGQWTLANLLSHQNVMSCAGQRRGQEASEPVSQRHMSIRTLYYWFRNVFYLHLSSSKEYSRPQPATHLGNVCFFKAVLPENCHPTLSVWQPQPSLGFVHIQAADISTQWCYLSCVCMLRFLSSLELWPLIPWNETEAHSWDHDLLWTVTSERAV